MKRFKGCAITPKYIIDALGPFDLDPCASEPQPWPCARMGWYASGLDLPWFGRVWLNPPFDRDEVGKWIAKLADHGNGIALLHARTEAEWFVPVWEKASAILFLADRLYFHYPDGRRAEANSGAPACLCAFDNDHSLSENWYALSASWLKGFFVTEWDNL
jgi:hypothetical protein